MLTPWDDRRNLVICDDHKAAINYASEHFLACAKESVQRHGAFFVALSGGSTPKSIYETLSKPPFSKLLPWAKIHLFWSDERSVPPDHADSNYKMALDAGFKDMPIPEGHIHRMVAEVNIEENTIAYEANIQRILAGRPFDLIMLGMGDDGHTASLFPHTKGLHVHDDLIIANHIPQKDTWRMTMTFTCINSARHIALYVLGASKKPMVANIFKGPYVPDDHPVQKVGVQGHPALWVLDKESSSGLFPPA